MKNKNELSVIGWLLLISIFAGLSYWFALPIKLLTSLWPCVQIILKGIIFVVMVMYQWMVVVEPEELDSENYLVTFVSMIGTAIVQLIAIYSLLVKSSDAFGIDSLTNFILAVYALMIWGAVFVYGLLILALIVVSIYTIGYGIIWVLAHPSQSTAPFAKILFKQPKKEKQEKPNKKIYL